MKAHISLIKKDLFLMGNYLCFIPVFTLVLPFFYYWRLPDFSLQKGTRPAYFNCGFRLQRVPRL